MADEARSPGNFGTGKSAFGFTGGLGGAPYTTSCAVAGHIASQAAVWSRTGACLGCSELGCPRWQPERPRAHPDVRKRRAPALEGDKRVADVSRPLRTKGIAYAAFGVEAGDIAALPAWRLWHLAQRMGLDTCRSITTRQLTALRPTEATMTPCYNKRF